jgi:hypothetical protein
VIFGTLPEPVVEEEGMTTILPAVLGFAAAITATALGYRQWRKQREFDRAKPYEDDRRAAYKELWTRVEALDVEMRGVSGRPSVFTDAEFGSRIRELNTFVLSNEIYFEAGVRERVKAYYAALKRLDELIGERPDAKEIEQFRREREITETGQLRAGQVGELQDAFGRAEAARAELMAEVRRNIGGS